MVNRKGNKSTKPLVINKITCRGARRNMWREVLKENWIDNTYLSPWYRKDSPYVNDKRVFLRPAFWPIVVGPSDILGQAA